MMMMMKKKTMTGFFDRAYPRSLPPGGLCLSYLAIDFCDVVENLRSQTTYSFGDAQVLFQEVSFVVDVFCGYTLLHHDVLPFSGDVQARKFDPRRPQSHHPDRGPRAVLRIDVSNQKGGLLTL